MANELQKRNSSMGPDMIQNQTESAPKVLLNRRKREDIGMENIIDMIDEVSSGFLPPGAESLNDIDDIMNSVPSSSSREWPVIADEFLRKIHYLTRDDYLQSSGTSSTGGGKSSESAFLMALELLALREGYDFPFLHTLKNLLRFDHSEENPRFISWLQQLEHDVNRNANDNRGDLLSFLNKWDQRANDPTALYSLNDLMLRYLNNSDNPQVAGYLIDLIEDLLHSGSVASIVDLNVDTLSFLKDGLRNISNQTLDASNLIVLWELRSLLEYLQHTLDNIISVRYILSIFDPDFSNGKLEDDLVEFLQDMNDDSNHTKNFQQPYREMLHRLALMGAISHNPRVSQALLANLLNMYIHDGSRESAEHGSFFTSFEDALKRISNMTLDNLQFEEILQSLTPVLRDIPSTGDLHEVLSAFMEQNHVAENKEARDDVLSLIEGDVSNHTTDTRKYQAVLWELGLLISTLRHGTDLKLVNNLLNLYLPSSTQAQSDDFIALIDEILNGISNRTKDPSRYSDVLQSLSFLSLYQPSSGDIQGIIDLFNMNSARTVISQARNGDTRKMFNLFQEFNEANMTDENIEALRSLLAHLPSTRNPDPVARYTLQMLSRLLGINDEGALKRPQFDLNDEIIDMIQTLREVNATATDFPDFGILQRLADNILDDDYIETLSDLVHLVSFANRPVASGKFLTNDEQILSSLLNIQRRYGHHTSSIIANMDDLRSLVLQLPHSDNNTVGGVLRFFGNLKNLNNGSVRYENSPIKEPNTFLNFLHKLPRDNIVSDLLTQWPFNLMRDVPSPNNQSSILDTIRGLLNNEDTTLDQNAHRLSDQLSILTDLLTFLEGGNATNVSARDIEALLSFLHQVPSRDRNDDAAVRVLRYFRNLLNSNNSSEQFDTSSTDEQRFLTFLKNLPSDNFVPELLVQWPFDITKNVTAPNNWSSIVDSVRTLFTTEDYNYYDRNKQSPFSNHRILWALMNILERGNATAPNRQNIAALRSLLHNYPSFDNVDTGVQAFTLLRNALNIDTDSSQNNPSSGDEQRVLTFLKNLPRDNLVSRLLTRWPFHVLKDLPLTSNWSSTMDAFSRLYGSENRKSIDGAVSDFVNFLRDIPELQISDSVDNHTILDLGAILSPFTQLLENYQDTNVIEALLRVISANVHRKDQPSRTFESKLALVRFIHSLRQRMLVAHNLAELQSLTDLQVDDQISNVTKNVFYDLLRNLYTLQRPGLPHSHSGTAETLINFMRNVARRNRIGRLITGLNTLHRLASNLSAYEDTSQIQHFLSVFQNLPLAVSKQHSNTVGEETSFMDFIERLPAYSETADPFRLLQELAHASTTNDTTGSSVVGLISNLLDFLHIDRANGVNVSQSRLGSSILDSFTNVSNHELHFDVLRFLDMLNSFHSLRMIETLSDPLSGSFLEDIGKLQPNAMGLNQFSPENRQSQTFMDLLRTLFMGNSTMYNMNNLQYLSNLVNHAEYIDHAHNTTFATFLQKLMYLQFPNLMNRITQSPRIGNWLQFLLSFNKSDLSQTELSALWDLRNLSRFRHRSNSNHIGNYMQFLDKLLDSRRVQSSRQEYQNLLFNFLRHLRGTYFPFEEIRQIQELSVLISHFVRNRTSTSLGELNNVLDLINSGQFIGRHWSKDSNPLASLLWLLSSGNKKDTFSSRDLDRLVNFTLETSYPHPIFNDPDLPSVIFGLLASVKQGEQPHLAIENPLGLKERGNDLMSLLNLIASRHSVDSLAVRDMANLLHANGLIAELSNISNDASTSTFFSRLNLLLKKQGEYNKHEGRIPDDHDFLSLFPNMKKIDATDSENTHLLLGKLHRLASAHQKLAGYGSENDILHDFKRLMRTTGTRPQQDEGRQGNRFLHFLKSLPEDKLSGEWWRPDSMIDAINRVPVETFQPAEGDQQAELMQVVGHLLNTPHPTSTSLPSEDPFVLFLKDVNNMNPSYSVSSISKHVDSITDVERLLRVEGIDEDSRLRSILESLRHLLNSRPMTKEIFPRESILQLINQIKMNLMLADQEQVIQSLRNISLHYQGNHSLPATKVLHDIQTVFRAPSEAASYFDHLFHVLSSKYISPQQETDGLQSLGDFSRMIYNLSFGQLSRDSSNALDLLLNLLHPHNPAMRFLIDFSNMLQEQSFNVHMDSSEWMSIYESIMNSAILTERYHNDLNQVMDLFDEYSHMREELSHPYSAVLNMLLEMGNLPELSSILDDLRKIGNFTALAARHFTASPALQRFLEDMGSSTGTVNLVLRRNMLQSYISAISTFANKKSN